MCISGKVLATSLTTALSSFKSTDATSWNIDRIDGEITYEEFHLKYLLQNRPCLFGKWMTKNWKSVSNWALSMKEGVDVSPNFDYLEQHFGSSEVPVANCSEKYYNSQEKHEQSLQDYLRYWKKFRHDGHPSERQCLYLKDWHFSRKFGEYGAYEVPVYFLNDWLNEFWDVTTNSSGDDYRFVYMGPKGSWTPFHADVYRSYSWSANICGKKEWILYPPGEEAKLKDKNGVLMYNIKSPSIDDRKYPGARLAVQPITVIQEAGEVIFVPSGWHHQVHNLEDTISVNHNWLNACNINIVWRFLCSELESVKKEIEDCSLSMTQGEWVEKCQVIMNALSGMDFTGFVYLAKTITMPRVLQLNSFSGDHRCKNCDVSAQGVWEEFAIFQPKLEHCLQRVASKTSGSSSQCRPDCSHSHGSRSGLCSLQAIFDLCKILDVLDEFLQHPDVITYSRQCGRDLWDDADQLFSDIYHCLQNVANSHHA